MMRYRIWLPILWLVGFCLPWVFYASDRLFTLPYWCLYIELGIAIILCGVAIGLSGLKPIIRAVLMVATLVLLLAEEGVLAWIGLWRSGLAGTQ